MAGIWTTVGCMSLLGLRAPLKFLPIFLLQLVYKSFWFAFNFTPLMMRGEFPDYGWASVIGNAIWMALDLKAIPWRYLFSTELTVEAAYPPKPLKPVAARSSA